MLSSIKLPNFVAIFTSGCDASTGRSARDAYTTEHLEIASYELLRRVAERAGDEETAAACREIREQERAMANYIEENWDVFAELSLREQGVPV